MPLENLRDWVGRTRAAEDFAAPFPVLALSATFDEKDPDPKMGDILPPLWHWLYFLEAAPQSKLGPDGHAERGDFLPPVTLPRRMWAGSRFVFDGKPPLLFRFSALTFNGHRIHYDQPYVTGTEGYPGLIVHGPLMGMVQIELARRSNPGKVARSFEFRALAPVYAGAAFSVQARHEADGSVVTWIADRNGGLAQQGRVTFQ